MSKQWSLHHKRKLKHTPVKGYNQWVAPGGAVRALLLSTHICWKASFSLLSCLLRISTSPRVKSSLSVTSIRRSFVSAWLSCSCWNVHTHIPNCTACSLESMERITFDTVTHGELFCPMTTCWNIHTSQHHPLHASQHIPYTHPSTSLTHIQTHSLHTSHTSKHIPYACPNRSHTHIQTHPLHTSTHTHPKLYNTQPGASGTNYI